MNCGSAASTIYDLLSTIYSPSAADRRQNRNLAIVWQRCFEQFLAPDVVVVEKNVYMLSQLPLLIQHAIAQANVPPPQIIKSFTNGCRRRVDNDLTLAIRKVR